MIGFFCVRYWLQVRTSARGAGLLQPVNTWGLSILREVSHEN